MKNKSALLLAAVMVLSLSAFTGCDGTSGTGNSGKIFSQKAPYYSSTSDVTFEKLVAHSSPMEMADYKGAFKVTLKYSGYDDETLNSGEYYRIYKKTGDKMEFNVISNYTDGFTMTSYLSNDKDDRYIYNMTNMGINRNETTEEEVKSIMENTVLGYADLDAELINVTEEDGKYIAEVKTEVGTDKITIDPKTGFLLKVLSTQNFSDNEVTVEAEFTYDGSFEIDARPKTDYKEPVEAEEDNSITGPAETAAEPDTSAQIVIDDGSDAEETEAATEAE